MNMHAEVSIRVGQGQQRLLALCYAHYKDGKPFPDLKTAAFGHRFANRGVAANTYLKIEANGLVYREGHEWKTGRFTPIGLQLAAKYFLLKAHERMSRKLARIVVAPQDVGPHTLHPHMVVDLPANGRVLEYGDSVSKLGGWVTKGRLDGARIHVLALEERATCATTCKVWDTCYGNGLHRARRWRHGKDLEAMISVQLERLDTPRRRQLRLVRLHEVGDFYAPDYVHKWGGWLRLYPWLNVFGYTSWGPKTEIGKAIAALKAEFGERFAIRWSGQTGKDGAVVMRPSSKEPKDAFWCPEQTRQTANCGTCGACWSSEKTVMFKEH